jgi:hypothetical protein
VNARRLDRPTAVQRLRELPRVAGALLRLADWRLAAPPWPGFPEPYAGQWARRAAIGELVASFEPDAIVETGTFLGLSTKHLACHGVPVHSVEIEPSYYHLAKLNLGRLANVNLLCGRSVDALRLLGADGGIRRPLAYLDAHWGRELPLEEEVDRLLSQWDDVVVVIDDCRVPDDDGYGYDVYDGVAISLPLLDIGRDVLAAYPSVPARDEGGARRGTLYLAHGPQACASFSQAVRNGHLRLAEPVSAPTRAGAPSSSASSDPCTGTARSPRSSLP